MSRWVDQFRIHKFQRTWASLRATIVVKIDVKGDESSASEIARLRKVVAYLDGVIEQIDPELMQLSYLDSLQQEAANAVQFVGNVKSDNNLSHLQNANRHLDFIITTLSQTPFLLVGQQKGSLTRAATAYSDALDEHLGRYKEAVDSSIGDLSASIDEISKRSGELQKSIVALGEQTKVVEQTIQKQTAEFNTQFQASEKARADEFSELAKKLQAEADRHFVELVAKAGVSLEVLGKLQDDASKVFAVVVNTAQAGAYASYANAEKKAANVIGCSRLCS